MYPSNYRGRPVTETNVQEYISNIVSKYLPPDLPPWQICVIPMSNTTRLDDAASPTLSATEFGPSGLASTSAATVGIVEKPVQQIEIDSSTALSVSVAVCMCVCTACTACTHKTINPLLQLINLSRIHATRTNHCERFIFNYFFSELWSATSKHRRQYFTNIEQ